MKRLDQLPDDVLIPIYSYCDISTLFSLRTTSTASRNIIDVYIRTIAPKSARATFPSCDTLLTPPASGYTVQWLRGLVPAQLASIVLDKDKLRRYPYVNAGFPYGIPSERGCEEARLWRGRIANGWRVLRGFYVVSRDVYAECGERGRRPSALRKVSGGMKGSRWWRAVACSYAECTEHGVKQLFDGSQCLQKETSAEVIEDVKRKESKILKKRLMRVEKLSDQDLLDYVYLWRLLFWTFRPYRKPDTTAQASLQDWQHYTDAPPPNWQSMISDITQGCSWLNWLVLHIGTTPFQQQWSLSSQTHVPNLVRNEIWKAWSARTPHQIEVERDYICKFEFAVRRRCLSSERLERLEAEIFRGRSIHTISLDCIPWLYDQHPTIMRSKGSFPWYETGELLWMDGETWLQTGLGVNWTQPGVPKMSLITYTNASHGEGDVDSHRQKGPLEKVPYLVYLGVEGAAKTWGWSDADATEFVF